MSECKPEYGFTFKVEESLINFKQLPHTIQLAHPIEFAYAAQTGVAVESESQVDEGRVICLERTILQN
jgi:hypothetical protein